MGLTKATSNKHVLQTVVVFVNAIYHTQACGVKIDLALFRVDIVLFI